jgi:hypothetical protein
MAKVHALMEFTDPAGEKHEVGEEFDLPRNTDQEKADFERLIEHGVVTRSEAKANPPVSEESETPQRTRRDRRSE